ncbi:N4-gp56 family major capsid protein [Xenophilus sp. Marseille-Q4582]|uniref:N4-gp56 family major capsid protein n=1 Tax=Xenophilus sp. Marseille-Q4582 TaxID=2866600 RepID=UPI001CE492F4|nr:N4-gp56 family major capsid protein [Xenophilus sp. Marseille-Q4582]
MAGATYDTPAQRIGKIKGEILAHAVATEVLGITGMQRSLPKNQGQEIIFRRWLPYGATATDFNTQNRPQADPVGHLLVEGVTPSPDSLVPQDIPARVHQYGCLYQLTDWVSDTYEDDVPAEMKKQCGERIALVREMIRYGALKACTNRFYSGGSDRTGVNAKISLNLLRRISRNLQANHAERVTGILSPSINIKTSPVEASYLVFVHTDAESDVRDLTGFVKVAEYGSRKVVSPYEIGSVENFRFITSPELAPYLGAGAAIGSTGLLGGTNVDVYPFIVVGENAWGQLALRGADSIDPTYIPPGTKDKSDPLGQRGYIGAKFWMTCVLLNEGWMAVAEAGVSSLA